MLIEYVYPNINKEIVFHGKNILCYMIAIYTCFTLYYDLNRKTLSYFLILHSIVDLPFSVKDIVLHHLLVICGVMVYAYYDIDNMASTLVLDKIISTETSSIFLCNGDTINYILEKAKDNRFGNYNSIIKKLMTILQPVNNLIFVFLFMKLRVYDFTMNIMLDKDTFAISHPSYIEYPITVNMRAINIWGLYGLNIYWFNIILKKLYKLTLKNIPRNNIIQYFDINFNIIPSIFYLSYGWNFVLWGFYRLVYIDDTIFNEKEMIYNIIVLYTLFVMYNINSFYDRTSLFMKMIMLQYIWISSNKHLLQ